MIASTLFQYAAELKEMEGVPTPEDNGHSDYHRAGCCHAILMSARIFFPKDDPEEPGDSFFAGLFHSNGDRLFAEMFHPGSCRYAYWWSIPGYETEQDYNARVIALYLMHEIMLDREAKEWNPIIRFANWWAARWMQDPRDE